MGVVMGVASPAVLSDKGERDCEEGPFPESVEEGLPAEPTCSGDTDEAFLTPAHTHIHTY